MKFLLKAMLYFMYFRTDEIPDLGDAKASNSVNFKTNEFLTFG